MNKPQKTLLIIASVIAVGCLLYLPGLSGLGWYRDAWNYFYNLTVRGQDMLIKAFSADRPADGYLISALYGIFGTDLKAYQIWNLCCRILSSVFFVLILLTVWKKDLKLAGFAGILAVAFPGFLEQTDAITYIPHQTAMLCFMISLWLTVLACKEGRIGLKILFSLLAMALSFVNMMLMEYYIGMEIYRLGMIYLVKRNGGKKDVRSGVAGAVLSFLPYLVPMLGFVAWRSFFFTAKRAGTDVMTEIIQPFLAHPRHELADLGIRIVKNVWKLFVGSWTIPAHTLINGLNMKEFVRTLIPVLGISAAGLLLLLPLFLKKKDAPEEDESSETAQWIWYGLICGTAAVFPLILTGRDINFTSSYDRFAWPGMIGAVLLLTGLFGSVPHRIFRGVLLGGTVLLSVFVQWQNQTRYIGIAENYRNYWQQLIWRAPSLEMGTTIVTSGLALAEEDYEIFAPASMIYYPDVKDWAPVSAEVLNENTIRDIRMGNKVYRNIREIYTEKDYQRLLAISRPDENACLRVINGRDPVYSVREHSKITEIGAYSDIGRIITEPEQAGVYPFFLGEEQAHGWCYYFEKMELALQQDDPEGAAALADEAAGKNLKAGDSVELIPVIEAYIRSGRTDDALPFADELAKDDYMAYQAIVYFTAKDDSEAYRDFVDVLKDISGIDPAETGFSD